MAKVQSAREGLEVALQGLERVDYYVAHDVRRHVEAALDAACENADRWVMDNYTRAREELEGERNARRGVEENLGILVEFYNLLVDRWVTPTREFRWGPVRYLDSPVADSEESKVPVRLQALAVGPLTVTRRPAWGISWR